VGGRGFSFFLLLFVIHDGMIMAAIERAVHILVMDGLFPDGKPRTAVSAMRLFLREAESKRKKIPPYHLNRHVLPHGMEKKENGFLFGIPFIVERQTQAQEKSARHSPEGNVSSVFFLEPEILYRFLRGFVWGKVKFSVQENV